MTKGREYRERKAIPLLSFVLLPQEERREEREAPSGRCRGSAHCAHRPGFRSALSNLSMLLFSRLKKTDANHYLLNRASSKAQRRWGKENILQTARHFTSAKYCYFVNNNNKWGQMDPSPCLHALGVKSTLLCAQSCSCNLAVAASELEMKERNKADASVFKNE